MTESRTTLESTVLIKKTIGIGVDEGEHKVQENLPKAFVKIDAPKEEAEMFSVSFFSELEASLNTVMSEMKDAKEDPRIMLAFDLDHTVSPQFTGGAPFKKFYCDELIELGRYDLAINHFAELRKLFTESSLKKYLYPTLLSFNDNLVRAQRNFTAMTGSALEEPHSFYPVAAMHIDSAKRYFANEKFFNQLKEDGKNWGEHCCFDFKKALLQIDMKEDEFNAVKSLWFNFAFSKFEAYQKANINNTYITDYTRICNDGKNYLLICQIFAFNKKHGCYPTHIGLVDDDEKNCNAIANLQEFLQLLAEKLNRPELAKIKVIPAILAKKKVAPKNDVSETNELRTNPLPI